MASTATNFQLAREYHSYMTFRAKEENLAHELDVNWYLTHLNHGIAFFFGVHHDGTHIVKDVQNKKAFKKWKELNIATI